MIADVIRLPGAFVPRALGALRRIHGGLGGLLESERERWLIRY